MLHLTPAPNSPTFTLVLSFPPPSRKTFLRRFLRHSSRARSSVRYILRFTKVASFVASAEEKAARLPDLSALSKGLKRLMSEGYEERRVLEGRRREV